MNMKALEKIKCSRIF